VGVEAQGRKHVLVVAQGASENAASAIYLLENVGSRGVNPDRRYLFVIDGSKALWAAINLVFGSGQPVQIRVIEHQEGYDPEKQPGEVGGGGALFL
jgi:transposase-like protein